MKKFAPDGIPSAVNFVLNWSNIIFNFNSAGKSIKNRSRVSTKDIFQIDSGQCICGDCLVQ